MANYVDGFVIPIPKKGLAYYRSIAKKACRVWKDHGALDYYECVGDVPNVAFPCATLYDQPTGRIALYYGGADTVTALAFAKLDEILDFIKTTSEV